MQATKEKIKKPEKQNSPLQRRVGSEAAAQESSFEDNRPEAAIQAKFQAMADNFLRSNSFLNNRAANNEQNKNHTLSVATGPKVIQREESLPDKIIRIVGRRGIELTPAEAEEYAQRLENNEQPRIRNHHRVLRMDRNGRVSTVKRLFSGKGMMGRVSEVEGPLAEEEVMSPQERLVLSGKFVTQASEVTLEGIGARESLAELMDGSAATITGIKDAEWLHLIAHQLGGKEVVQNIVAGSHSLNTAMIPIENFVRDIASQGIKVNYDVIFWTKTMENPVSKETFQWVHTAEVFLETPTGQGVWTLTEQGMTLDSKISEHNLLAIKQSIKEQFPNYIDGSDDAGPSGMDIEKKSDE